MLLFELITTMEKKLFRLGNGLLDFFEPVIAGQKTPGGIA